MRGDVKKFAEWMNEAMESKRIERDSRNDPQYAAPEYPISHAIACMMDKAEQLETWANAKDYERAKKTAVHLANFCMIIVRKIEIEL